MYRTAASISLAYARSFEISSQASIILSELYGIKSLFTSFLKLISVSSMGISWYPEKPDKLFEILIFFTKTLASSYLELPDLNIPSTLYRSDVKS